MLSNILLVGIGFAALFLGGDSLVKGAARLASAFGVPSLVIGLTVVAFGTSVPELLVSLQAAVNGSSDIALGNVLGSNVANIGLILGISGLIYPIAVEWRLIRQEIPLMIAISVITLLLAMDNTLGPSDGLLLFMGFLLFTIVSMYLAFVSRRQIQAEVDEFCEEEDLTPKPVTVNNWLELGRLLLGIVLLAFGADWAVQGATGIARESGVSEFIIGVTIVAFGTSLPELIASIMAALRRESDIAIGNVIGSNIANLLAILGITSLVRPIPVDPGLFAFEFPAMILFAALLLPFVLRQILHRPSAALLLAGYIGFIAFSVLR